MEPPYFVWKAGTLDVCDTLDELHDRYPASELAHKDVIACDSEGRAIWISREIDGHWTNAVAGPQPPTHELLRGILWKYLESRGTPPEEIESLALSELVEKVRPPDPMGEYREKARLQGCIAAIVVIVVFALIAFILDRCFPW